MQLRALGTIVREACIESVTDRVPRLGAALAFYLTFSLAPLLLVVVVVASVAFGRQAAEGRVMSELRPLVGVDAEVTLHTLISGAGPQRSGALAGLVAGITVLIGAVGFFCELQDALNGILDIPPRPIGGAWSWLYNRLPSFILILGCGALLLVSLAISTVASAITGMIDGTEASSLTKSVLIHAIPTSVSLIVITVLFAMIYRFLPDARFAWRHVWFGSIASSLLFAVGKSLLSLYLGQIAIASVYGAAASIIVLMLWNYYSVQIFLFGAELMKAHSRHDRDSTASTSGAILP